MYSFNFYLKAIRFLLLLSPLISTILFFTINNYYLFISTYLLIIINSQLRVILNNIKWIKITLIMDIILIFYLSIYQEGFFAILLLITLLDAIIITNNLSIIFYFLITAIFLYLIKGFSLEIITLLTVFYLIIVLFSLHLRKELLLRTNTEYLYDQIRRSNYELESARTRLLNYSKQVEKIAQLEERNRITRDLHDSLGHSLTGILLQVDAATKLIKHDQVKGIQLLDSVYENINKSIENVSQTIKKISPINQQPYISSLKKLIKDFDMATNVSTSFKITGNISELSPSAEITIYRTIQEGLTNAVRHGNANKIEIVLSFSKENIMLTIYDDGSGSDNLTYGFGLLGMKERIELLEGTVFFRSENGFHITANIPIKED